MKISILVFGVLLSVMPALATISGVQSGHSWNNTSVSSCTVQLTNTTTGHLLVVWATWGPDTLAVQGISDNNNSSFPTAVGPTVQPVSNTAAQLSYLGNIQGTFGTDRVTVTFSGTATTASCVAVEYMGADTVAPLDSVSEAISNSGSPSNGLDSGTASPANASLLVFGGGIIDYGSGGIIPGSGFTNVQSNAIGSASAITEQNIITTNNALQRATACLGGGLSCNSNTGNWLMQMAVFRAATWTGAQGTSSTRVHQVLYADQFPGAPDVGLQVNNAYAALPSTGGQIVVSGGPYTFTTPIAFTTFSKPALLTCTNNTAELSFSPSSQSGAAVTLDWGIEVPPTGAAESYGGIIGCNLVGNGGSTVGIQLGETGGYGHTNRGTVGATVQGNMVTGFNYGMQQLEGGNNCGPPLYNQICNGTFLLHARGNFFGLNLTAGVDLQGTSENMEFTGNCFCNNSGSSGSTGTGFSIESGASIYSLGLYSNSFDTNAHVGFYSDGLVAAAGKSNHWEDNVLTACTWCERFIDIVGGSYHGDGDTFNVDATSGGPVPYLIYVGANSEVDLKNPSVGIANVVVSDFISIDSNGFSHVVDPLLPQVSGANVAAVVAPSNYNNFWLEQTNPSYTAGYGASVSQYRDWFFYRYNESNSGAYSLDWQGNIVADSITLYGNAVANALTSTVATGTAPITVSSTTPVANLTVANHPLVYEGPASGALATNELQYWDTVVGSGSPATYTFKGTFTYTSASTFGCVCTDQSTQTACQASPGTANTVSLTGGSGDTVFIFCTGH